MMKMKLFGLTVASLVGAMGLSAATIGQGTIGFDQQFSTQGTGFGNVLAAVTVHSTPGDPAIETGCVNWVSGADATGAPCADAGAGWGGNESTAPGVQNQTYTLGELQDALGINSIDEIALIVNPSQTGNDPVITLEGLYFAIFDAAGTEVLYSYYWQGGGDCGVVPCELSQDNLGIGGQGFGFRVLDSAPGLVFDRDYVVGVGVQFSNWNDGPDTVNISRFEQDTPPEVPEPSSMLLMGGGLLGLAFWRKRRNS